MTTQLRHRATLSVAVVAAALASMACTGRATEALPTGPNTPAIINRTILIEQITMLVLESYPTQVHVKFQATLPDSCSEVDTITQNRSGQSITLLITSRHTPGDCSGSGRRVPVDVRLDGGFESGDYTVTINGTTKRFTI